MNDVTTEVKMDAAPMGALVCGVDIVDLALMGRALQVGGQQFLDTYYTEAEQQYCQGNLACLAKRWAAKEAVVKALGTGMQGIALHDIEVLPDALGQPQVRLVETAQARAAVRHLGQWAISLSHSGGQAVAFVVAHEVTHVVVPRVADIEEERPHPSGP